MSYYVISDVWSFVLAVKKLQMTYNQLRIFLQYGL